MVNKRRGSIPDGQTSRGYPDRSAPNPKNNSTRRPDVLGKVPGEGGAVEQGTSYTQTSTNFPSSTVPNRFPRGGSEPDVTLNRGYTRLEDANLPSPKNTGANRQNFGLSPAEPPQPDGDTSDRPGVPRFGVGTTGE